MFSVNGLQELRYITLMIKFPERTERYYKRRKNARLVIKVRTTLHLRAFPGMIQYR